MKRHAIWLIICYSSLLIFSLASCTSVVSEDEDVVVDEEMAEEEVVVDKQVDDEEAVTKPEELPSGYIVDKELCSEDN